MITYPNRLFLPFSFLWNECAIWIFFNLPPNRVSLYKKKAYFKVKFHLLKSLKRLFLLSFFPLANAMKEVLLSPFFKRMCFALPVIFRSKPGYLCFRIFIILSLDWMQQLHNLFFSTFIHVYYSSLFCAKQTVSLSTLESMYKIIW